MLNKIADILERYILIPPAKDDESDFARQHIAAAALLVEACRVDSDFDPLERATVTRLVRDHFRLSPEEADMLVAVAEKRQDESYTDFMFTDAILKAYAKDERAVLVGMLWEVAYADGVLHDYEDQMIRRVAASLQLSADECNAAKKKAAESLGLSGTE